jgi:hypothetical protein
VKRKTFVIVVGAATAAMVFAGVTLSRGGTSAFVAPTPEQAAEATRKAPGANEKAHAAPLVDGRSWGLRSYPNTRSEVCLSHDVPGELVGTGCIAADRMFRRGPVYAIHGARQVPAGYPKTEWDNQWVYGIAHPAVRTVTLVNMDCSTQQLPLDEDGAFNYVAGHEQIEKGQLQWKLIARGAGGEVLAEREVAIGLTRNAKNAGHAVPVPKRDCRWRTE